MTAFKIQRGQDLHRQFRQVDPDAEAVRQKISVIQAENGFLEILEGGLVQILDLHNDSRN